MRRNRHKQIHKPTKETKYVEYSIRRIKRYIKLTVWVFLWFLIIMGIIWVVPEVWNWALG